MSRRLVLVLIAVAFAAAACGPSHGLRLERTDGSAGLPGTGGPARAQAGITVAGSPISLASDGRTVFASVLGQSGRLGIQAINPQTARALGVLTMPYVSPAEVAMATTPKRLWLLVSTSSRSELVYLCLQDEANRLILRTIGAKEAATLPLGKHALVFPIDSTLVGATSSAIWIVSHAGSDYSLWRVDARTAKARRFALATDDYPAVAVTARNVFVLLHSRAKGTVVTQTRDPAGTVVGTSPPVTMEGLDPGSVVACGNQIFGSTRDAHGAALFRLRPDGGGLTYSKSLFPSAAGSRAMSIALSDHCRRVSVATWNRDRGESVVSQLRASSLAVTSRIDTAFVCSLLWARGGLWAAVTDHAAVVRIR